MLVSPKPSQWPRTTHVDAHLPVFKNLVKGRALNAPNQVWASDITYIRTLQAFLYLALITDSWSRKIVGFHLGQTLESETALKALAMALKGLPRGQRPIHHSDRGCQYASHKYVQSAQRAGLTMSMTESNHSAENALAPSGSTGYSNRSSGWTVNLRTSSKPGRQRFKASEYTTNVVRMDRWV